MEVIQVAVRKYLLHVWFKDLVNLETIGYDDQALPPPSEMQKHQKM